MNWLLAFQMTSCLVAGFIFAVLYCTGDDKRKEPLHTGQGEDRQGRIRWEPLTFGSDLDALSAVVEEREKSTGGQYAVVTSTSGLRPIGKDCLHARVGDVVMLTLAARIKQAEESESA